MKYGYARVSTDDQSTALQLAALKRAGWRVAPVPVRFPTLAEGAPGPTPLGTGAELVRRFLASGSPAPFDSPPGV